MSTTENTNYIILTPKEAAEKLRCSSAMVLKLSRTGELPCVRYGRKVGILESDLIKFIEVSRYPKPRALTNAR